MEYLRMLFGILSKTGTFKIYMSMNGKRLQKSRWWFLWELLSGCGFMHVWHLYGPSDRCDSCGHGSEKVGARQDRVPIKNRLSTWCVNKVPLELSLFSRFPSWIQVVLVCSRIEWLQSRNWGTNLASKGKETRLFLIGLNPFWGYGNLDIPNPLFSAQIYEHVGCLTGKWLLKCGMVGERNTAKEFWWRNMVIFHSKISTWHLILVMVWMKIHRRLTFCGYPRMVMRWASAEAPWRIDHWKTRSSEPQISQI